MVDLKIDIRNLFPQRVVKVTSDLVPQSFHGNRYEVTDAKHKTTQIIDSLGMLSASAQKLNKPITTTRKLLEYNDQTIYLMADTDVKPRGVAIGLLKVGKKDLYVYDKQGQQYKVNSPCILDFYIFDTYQRTGHGKVLFDTMLAEEKLQPHKFTIDRPSEKMISFLKKHYGLHKTIPQGNHYLLYEGYFDGYENDNDKEAVHRVILPPCRKYLAYKMPSHCNGNRVQRLAVTRFETQPDHSMAEIIQQLESRKG